MCVVGQNYLFDLGPADIFSLGATLFAMLFGTVPFGVLERKPAMQAYLVGTHTSHITSPDRPDRTDTRTAERRAQSAHSSPHLISSVCCVRMYVGIRT